MDIISILNLKGGVGKSFTAINMSYEFKRRGFRVLDIDNDKQGNLSRAFNRYQANGACKVGKLLKKDWKSTEDIIQKTDYENIDIITSNMSLLTDTFQLTYSDQGEQHNRYKILIDKVKDQYDFCIIDNPPDISLNVINALAISNEVIVPVKIDEWALEGLDIVSEQIREAKKLNPSIKLLGVLVTMYRNNNANIAGLEWLEKKSPIKVIGKIRYSEKAVDSTFFSKPIYEYSPLSAAAQDYKKFVSSYLENRR